MKREGKDSPPQKKEKKTNFTFSKCGRIISSKQEHKTNHFLYWANLAFVIKNICYNHCGNAVYNQSY